MTDLHALAYMGDAIYEVLVREWVISQGKMSSKKRTKWVHQCVNATAQMQVLENLEGILTEVERETVKKGMNLKVNSVPKSATVQVYRLATGLEVLVGYLYYDRQYERLRFLFQQAFQGKDMKEDS